MIGFTHVGGATAGLEKEDIPRMVESHRAWAADTDSRPSSSLVYFAPANEAKNVRMHADGRLDVEDGTFAGGKEALGGFTIIEAESLEEALEYAKRHRWLPGSNEVRELETPPNLKAWIRSQ